MKDSRSPFDIPEPLLIAMSGGRLWLPNPPVSAGIPPTSHLHRHSGSSDTWGTSTSTPLSDPIALLRDLTVDQIRDRLDALEAEASALRVLLRSAAARKRARHRRPSKEGAHG